MACQLLSPVIELPFQYLALQPFPLPLRIIGILNRQRLQWGSRTSTKSAIQRVELSQHHSQRPAVGNDVMHHHQQDMVLTADPEQRRPNQWGMAQIKWPPCLFAKHLIQ